MQNKVLAFSLAFVVEFLPDLPNVVRLGLSTMATVEAWAVFLYAHG